MVHSILHSIEVLIMFLFAYAVFTLANRCCYYSGKTQSPFRHAYFVI